ncbi:hypothetical protein Noda2021_01900 [Candidatus Dependentiae bacterium Noda2021]|nr:hypothetical protein Noda2021_01900 [Candidatus Dependentiae bacterium Noda2021]
MILFGTQEITNVMFTQHYFCIKCRRVEMHDFKQIRNFFSLFYVPIVPLARIICYSECHKCGDIEELSPEMTEVTDQSLFLPRYWYAPLSLVILFPFLLTYFGSDLFVLSSGEIAYKEYFLSYLKMGLMLLVLRVVYKIIGNTY